MTELMESVPLGSTGTADPQRLADLVTQFALLADPLRLRIVRALATEQLRTSDLIQLTGAKQPTVSHHLRILREAGVVVGEADGRFTWYRLIPEALLPAAVELQELVAGGLVQPRRGARIG